MLPASSIHASPTNLLAAALAAAGLETTHGAPLLEAAAERIRAEYTREFGEHLFGLAPQELRAAAKMRAEWYMEVARICGMEGAKKLAEHEFKRPIPGVSLGSQFARITDAKFWSRYYLRTAKRVHELAYIRAGFVHLGREAYVSDATLAHYRQYKRDVQHFIKTRYVVDRKPNDAGKHHTFPLADVVKSDQAKCAKVWAFLRGIDELSIEAGLSCCLLTLTLEPAYHPTPASGGTAWDGSKDAAVGGSELSRRWNCVQRDLDNIGIALSGARFAEPHGDSCPHWHVWLHYQEQHMLSILSVLSKYFPLGIRTREVYEDPKGKYVNRRTRERFSEQFSTFDSSTGSLAPCRSRRRAQVDWSIVNRRLASGATYAAKYAMKSLTPSIRSERVDASRWLWGMRSFQLFGVRSCVTAWEEIYRSKTVPIDPVARALFDAVHERPGRHSAQRRNRATGKIETIEIEGGTAMFIRLQGGLAAAGRGCPDPLRVKLMYVPATGRYGDSVRRKVGVRVANSMGDIWATTTREPGRFVIIAETALASSLRAIEEQARSKSP